MSIKFKISDHAAKRFRERFESIGLSMNFLLENSIPFGGQKGAEYLLLNRDYEVVFPIACYHGEHTVKTVLTTQQAKANLSMSNKELSFDLEPSKVEVIQKQLEDEKTEINNKLKELAREYLSNRPENHRNCPGPHEARLLAKRIKKKLSASNKQIEKFFIGEMARIIRESDWDCLDS